MTKLTAPAGPRNARRPDVFEGHRERAACTNGTSAAIAAAAVELFRRKGYSSTSVREIVETAGVTRPSLYYYYGSKEGLYIEIISRGRLLIDNLLCEVDRAEGDAWQKIERLCLGLHSLVKERSPELRMLVVCILAHSDHPSSEKVEALFRGIHERLCSLLEEGLREGIFRFERLDEAADLIHCLLLASSPLLAGRGTALSSDPKRLLDLAFRGLGAPPRNTSESPKPRPGGKEKSPALQSGGG